jgi:type II secretory pathway predicted ATPase ExeA
MARFFNTAGPNRPEQNYTLTPLRRLSSIKALIDDERYFIIHAPRQTGKTTAMMALMRELNAGEKYVALYVNIEAAQAYREDTEAANSVIVSCFRVHIRAFLPKEWWPSEACFQIQDQRNGMTEFLQQWMAELPRPLVLLIDEVDALIGDSLLSVLRQVRSGYNMRPQGFPHSVAMIGLRDLRDYRIFSGSEQRYVIGGSAFNIKDESLTVRYFTPEEVRELYAQHTAETGQVFEDEALDLVFYYTQGQPWLVNAIGKAVCFKEINVPRDQPVTADHIRQAVEVLILRRDVHLDQLADKLTEPRVANIIRSILLGNEGTDQVNFIEEDIRYLLDLGLIRQEGRGLEIANPIYKEVIPRELSSATQDLLGIDRLWYITPEGKLNLPKLLEEFLQFYRENGALFFKNSNTLYKEAAFHLLFMAWLQRIVNGKGKILREYALGFQRIDLYIEFGGDKFIFELKTGDNFRRERALNQTAAYARQMGLDQAHILIFRKDFADIDGVGRTETVEHEEISITLIWI